jgi:hypothetical protein
MPKKRERGDTRIQSFTSESGKSIKVTRTTYYPVDDFYFTDEPFTPEVARQLVGGTLQLKLIDELKVNGKIFAYVINVTSMMSHAQSNSNSLHNGHPFGYPILDKDGDGKFETLLPDDDVELQVPAWVSE